MAIDVDLSEPSPEVIRAERAAGWSRLGFSLGLLSAAAWLMAVSFRSPAWLLAAGGLWVPGAGLAFLFWCREARGTGDRRARPRTLGPVALYFGVLLALLLAPALDKARFDEDCRTARGRFRQVVLAMHAYAADHDNRLPPPVRRGPNGKALLSWRVLLLPYLGEANLHRQFRLDEPWDSPHNRALLPRRPEAFAPPRGAGASAGPSETFCQAVVGPKTAFEGEIGPHLPASFPNGTANTLVLVEARRPVPWTAPQDVPYDPVGPLPVLGGVFTASPLSRLLTFFRNDGFHAAMADGSVLFLPSRVSDDQLEERIEPVRPGFFDGGDW